MQRRVERPSRERNLRALASTLALGALVGCSGVATEVPEGASADELTSGIALKGINLPPKQGNSNAGSFLPGVYDWSYTATELATVVRRSTPERCRSTKPPRTTLQR